MSPTVSDPSSPECTHLRVHLSVTPSSEAGCTVLDSGDRGTVSMHETLRPGETFNDNRHCKAETTANDAPRPRLVEGNVTSRCICPVFSEHDCLASIESFEGDTLSVSVAVSDREELTAIVAALRERGATVRLRRIASSTVDTGRQMLELDTNRITEKQREAVQAAVQSGYYETPRQTDLTDLADRLDVSRSAVSQRLTAVESKLVEELFRADSSDGQATESAAGD